MPSASFYVLGTEIVFSLCLFDQNKNADILVVPFRNLKFDLYAGNIINHCSYDYRKRIQEKIVAKEIHNGTIYIKDCIGNTDYKFFAFLKLE